MAEDHLKRSASLGSTRRDDPSFEEDPLIELARIVAEDGGFRRQRTPELRPARNEAGRHDGRSRAEAIASQLEAELMQDWDMEDSGPDLPPQRPVTEVRGAGAAGRAEPAHVPLRPAASGEHRPSARFPEIVIEDAPPPRAASGRPHEDWRHAPREEVTEPFEEELSALFSDAEASRPADAAHGLTDEGAAAMSLAEYEESYADSYSAEVHDYDSVADADSAPEEFFAEEDASELAAIRREPARRGRSYKGLIAAVGVLGVVILGGAVAALVGGVGSESDGGVPPLIRAEAGPAKVEPEETADASAEDGAGQAVYDRVAGRAPKSDEKLVDRAEEPRQVSRVVLPGADAGAQPDEAAAGASEADEPSGGAAGGQPAGASEDESVAGRISSETAAMQNGPRISPVGPRRVRTVTVRPDGSIVSEPASVRVAEAASQPLGEVEAGFDGGDAPDPVPVRTVTVDGAGDGPSRSLQSEAPEAQSDSAAAQPFMPAAGSRQPEPAAQDGDDGAGATGAAEAAEPVPPAEERTAMLPRARPDDVPAAFSPVAAQRSEPQRAAARPAAAAGGGQPVDLLAAGSASPGSQAQQSQAQQSQASQQTARAASPSAAGPYLVQISAQRSEEQARATFGSLQSQFPSLLGDHEPQIERADLGERGIYYRVRVGAGSQAEAVQLCEQLKAAGGSCFVAR